MIKQVTLADSKSVWDQAYAANRPHVPFLTHSWHMNWSDVFGSDHTPLYLSVDDAIIAPFVVNGDRLIFSGGEEGADYLDLVGPEALKEPAWEQILPFLGSHGIKSMLLRNVPEDSPTVSFFRKNPAAGVQKEDSTPHLILPSRWEEYIESLNRKDRHELERKIRKFEREHIDAEIHESSDPARDIELLLTLMAKDPDKKNFLTPRMQTFFRAIARTYADTISLLTITMGDKTAAVTLSFIEDNTSYLYNSGFDRECCANGGFYLKAMSIKKSIEKGLAAYNFLQGQERYKYELGGKDFLVYQITLSL